MVAVGGLHGAGFHNEGGYGGFRFQMVSTKGFFVCWLLCLCLFWVLFIFLVGVATLFAATIDNDGSLWRLLELHGCKKL